MTREQWDTFKAQVEALLAEVPVERLTLATISLRWEPEGSGRDEVLGRGYTQTDGTERGWRRPKPTADVLAEREACAAYADFVRSHVPETDRATRMRAGALDQIATQIRKGQHYLRPLVSQGTEERSDETFLIVTRHETTYTADDALKFQAAVNEPNPPAPKPWEFLGAP